MQLDSARAIYFEEAREQCAVLEAALLGQATVGEGDDTASLMFRAAHTIKGSAGMFGLDAIVRFAHVMENVLDRLRNGQVELDKELTNLLLACNDHLRHLVAASEADLAAATTDLPAGAPLLEKLTGYSALAATPAKTPEATPPPAPSEISNTPAADPVDNPAWHVSVQFHHSLFCEGFDPQSFLRYLHRSVELKNMWPVLGAYPALETLDPTGCWLGLEFDVPGENVPDLIANTFEFIAEDSAIHTLPPHAALADYRALACQLGGGDPALYAGHWQQAGTLSADEATRLQQPETLAAPVDAPAEETVPSPALTVTATSLATATASASPEASAPRTAPTRAGERRETQYIRIEAHKLDRLINRVGELVIAAAGTTLLAASRQDAELLESVALLNSLVENIRDDSLTLRMVPINDIFSRFPRMVRDVAQQLGKDIQLQIVGADTEIDKSMVEKLTDPLMHIVRNAMDHGIEPLAQRSAAGKPHVGTLTLKACHDTGTIVVEVRDDGRGIDPNKVLAKALERGLVSDCQILSDKEILDLIFLPGFSTADKVSDLSGRGVGMDVVRKNIESLRGEVEIHSTLGQGSCFRIRLPLTLAIIDGFHVEVEDSALVIPLDMMIECLEMPTDAMRHEARQINVRGSWVPFVSLRELFGMPATLQTQYVVMVQFGDRTAGIVVDRLVGEVQAVIKPLGQIFRSLRGISGSTILGNGKPALILDMPQLIQLALRQEHQWVARHGRVSTQEPP